MFFILVTLSTLRLSWTSHDIKEKIFVGQSKRPIENATVLYKARLQSYFDNSTDEVRDRESDRNIRSTRQRIRGIEDISTNAYLTKYKYIFEAVSESENNTRSKISQNVRPCRIAVTNGSILNFQNVLLASPHLVQFRIILQGNTTYGSLRSVFQPTRWYWTPNTTAGPFPFLSWNLDYGILSFGLLETSNVDVPYVTVNVSGDCNMVFGTSDTSNRITKALVKLINISAHTEITYNKGSYFCYLTINDEEENTISHYASLYIIYPVSHIQYKCCTVRYNYSTRGIDPDIECPETIPGLHMWDQTSLLPFLFGLLILAYCPVNLLEIFAWISKLENIYTNDEQGDINRQEYQEIMETNDDWVFEDGQSPLTFGDLFGFNLCGLDKSHPILVSRFRRLFCILVLPSVIYFQLFLYRNGIGLSKDDKITVSDLVDAGSPMGFLAIMGSEQNRSKVFVPYLGGPEGVIILYFILGTLFVVLPRSFKRVVEDGLPSENGHAQSNINSPLFLSADDIVAMSVINVAPDMLIPGYTKGATLMKCGFYMLFTKSFWVRVWKIQKTRFPGRTENMCKKVAILFYFPVYVVICSLEVFCCIVYYGIPFCFFVVVIVRGASKGLGYLRQQSRCLFYVFQFKLLVVICVSIVFILAAIYSYIVALIFLKSFEIISKIAMLCFVAIIIYPSVSFGYIFFFTAALYFCFRQIRQFGGVYATLLTTAVELSDDIEGMSNQVVIQNGSLIISNVRYEHLIGIRINGKLLDLSPNVLRSANRNRNVKVRERNNATGIPRTLFQYLIEIYRPLHQQVLYLVFKVSAMATLIFLTLSVSSSYATGPTTEISEVMHVIFIVAVGALPELIEATVSNRDDVHLEKEIEKRNIKQSIEDFWQSENTVQN